MTLIVAKTAKQNKNSSKENEKIQDRVNGFDFYLNVTDPNLSTLPRNDLLIRLYWGTQWTMEIS